MVYYSGVHITPMTLESMSLLDTSRLNFKGPCPSTTVVQVEHPPYRCGRAALTKAGAKRVLTNWENSCGNSFEIYIEQLKNICDFYGKIGQCP
jgi:hypothetical protein